MPTVLNGANEIAVDAFLKRKISFLRIPYLAEVTMEKHKVFSVDGIEEVLEADTWARNTAKQELNRLQ
jgi:1-deoxy-D-xylulose-5-phosphate reductoisomerase